jgi:hypothetical protein
MVNYDSKSKSLVYKMVFQLNGQTLYTQATEVSLSQLDEVTRQVAIAVAKMSVNFANGNSIAKDLLKPALINGAKATSDKSPAQQVSNLTGMTLKEAELIMTVESPLVETKDSSELTA